MQDVPEAPVKDNARRKRLAVARFWYEGNSFCPKPADEAAFERYEWRKGDDALRAAAGTATELGAVVDFRDARPDWEVVTFRCAAASPAGPILDEIIARFLTELRADLLASSELAPWDAIYISLHGAAITDKRLAPDLDIVQMVRDLFPDIPFGVSLDLHGNIPEDFGNLVDHVSSYRTHPHVDMRETARRVLENLERQVCEGLRTV